MEKKNLTHYALLLKIQAKNRYILFCKIFLIGRNFKIWKILVGFLLKKNKKLFENNRRCLKDDRKQSIKIVNK